MRLGFRITITGEQLNYLSGSRGYANNLAGARKFATDRFLEQFSRHDIQDIPPYEVEESVENQYCDTYYEFTFKLFMVSKKEYQYLHACKRAGVVLADMSEEFFNEICMEVF